MPVVVAQPASALGRGSLSCTEWMTSSPIGSGSQPCSFSQTKSYWGLARLWQSAQLPPNWLITSSPPLVVISVPSALTFRAKNSQSLVSASKPGARLTIASCGISWITVPTGYAPPPAVGHRRPLPAGGPAVRALPRAAGRLLERLPAVPLTVAGILPVIAGMAWLSRISPATGYAPGVLGPMILFGTGMGLAFVPLTTSALAGVRQEDAGAAASLVNVTQQVGGAVGLAVLVTVFAAASRGTSRSTGGSVSRLTAVHVHLVHGMASAFSVATVFDVGALLVMAGAAVLALRRRGASR